VTANSPDPEQLEKQGMQAFKRGRFDDAAQAFRQARWGYEQLGQDVRAAQAANSLCVALLQAGKHEQALEAVRGTPQLLHQAGEMALEAQATGNLASALEACGHSAEAEAAYRKAADDFMKLGDQENRAHTLKALSQLQLRRGRPLEASVSMQAALESQPDAGLRQRWLRKLLDWPFRLLGR
jgi:tetratricopeptide (TPR) repeat protein